mgnify:CR=1 FL=1
MANSIKIGGFSFDALKIGGSDVDAALHYLGRLIVSGDYDSIYRRMIVIAYEDIGLANPGIGPKVIAAVEACERIGYPELQIPLSVIVTEMALSPKSNSAYSGIAAAGCGVFCAGRNGGYRTCTHTLPRQDTAQTGPHRGPPGHADR